jgi:hypothetical protein
MPGPEGLGFWAGGREENHQGGPERRVDEPHRLIRSAELHKPANEPRRIRLFPYIGLKEKWKKKLVPTEVKPVAEAKMPPA